MLQISDVVNLVYDDVKLWGGKYVDVGDFGMSYLKTLCRFRFWVLSDLVIRPLPWQVRLHGRSTNLNKKKFYWFWERSHGSCPGSLPRVVCAVLLFVMPFIITYLSLHSILPLWIRWDTSEDSLQLLSDKVLSINFIRKGLGFSVLHNYAVKINTSLISLKLLQEEEVVQSNSNPNIYIQVLSI